MRGQFGGCAPEDVFVGEQVYHTEQGRDKEVRDTSYNAIWEFIYAIWYYRVLEIAAQVPVELRATHLANCGV